MKVYVLRPSGSPLLLDSEDGPVAMVLTAEDKKLIGSMHPDDTIYCRFPDSYSNDAIDEWLGKIKAQQ